VNERARDRLARASMVVMMVLLFYFIGYGVHAQQKADAAGRKRDAAIAALAGTQKGIVAKLTEVFTQVLQLQATGKAPPEADIARITESLKGYVDPALIQRAVEAAREAVKNQTGPAGPTGPQGKTGATGAQGQTGAPAATTTSTARAVTTSSTTGTSTTTTRPCLVSVARLKLGC